MLTIGAVIIFVRSKTKWHSIVSWRCFSVINLFLKKIYYRHLLWKESEFHGEWTGVFGFSIYRAHKSVLTIGAVIIFVRSKTKWHSIVSWRCFSAINLFLKKNYYRHLLWKESEFHGEWTDVFGFSIYRAHKSVLTIGAVIIFVRSKTKWHSIVSWRCFSVINRFLKKIYYRHLLWKESEFHGEWTGVFGFSIYRAHKFLWRDLYRHFTCMYYERFLWYGHANNLARLFEWERETKCVSTEFYSESTGVFGFSIYRAHKSVLTIGAVIIFVRSKTKWHSIVSWRCFSVINRFLKKIYYRHLLWKESEFHGEWTGVFGFSIYRAHKSVLTIGAVIIFVRSKTKWHSIVSWRCFSVINLFVKKIYYRHLLWKESEFYSEWTGVFGFSIYRAHKSVLTIGAVIIFVRSKTKWHSIVSWRCFSVINLFLKKNLL